MKNVIIFLTIALSAITTSARSIDTTPVVATVSGYQNGILQVALLADGRLQIIKGELRSTEKQVETIILSDLAKEDLFDLAQGLSKIEVKEERHMVICAMMEPLALHNLSIGAYDWQSGQFDSKLKLILTNDSCATSYQVAPVQEWAQSRAAQLKKALVILALNSVKSEEQK